MHVCRDWQFPVFIIYGILADSYPECTNRLKYMLDAIVDLIIPNIIWYGMLLGDRIQSKVDFIQRTFRLHYSNDEESISLAFGINIWVHNRWNIIITRTIYLPHWIMTIDLCVSWTISRTLLILLLPIYGTMTWIMLKASSEVSRDSHLIRPVDAMQWLLHRILICIWTMVIDDASCTTSATKFHWVS